MVIKETRRGGATYLNVKFSSEETSRLEDQLGEDWRDQTRNIIRKAVTEEAMGREYDPDVKYVDPQTKEKFDPAVVEAIRRIIKKDSGLLSPRQAEVIKLRLGLDRQGEEFDINLTRTGYEVGEMLGLVAASIYQYEAKVLSKARAWMTREKNSETLS